MNNLSNILYDFLHSYLRLNDGLSSLLVSLIIIVIWIFIGIIINKFMSNMITSAINRKNRDSRTKTITKLVLSILRWVIWFVIILIVLEQFGVDITPLIASAGILGLAVGFGAQELVRDFISGFFIILEHTFDIDEVVEINGFKGNVVAIGFRSTVIKNWKGEVKTVNNGSIGSVINFSRNNSIGIVDFGVAYETDLKEFSQLMESFVVEMKNKYEEILEVPSFLGVTELADSSINMRIIFTTKPMQFFALERSLRKEIVMYCASNNVTIPFPQLVVHNES